MKASRFKTVCTACEDGRVCDLSTNRQFKQDPETCPWSNTTGTYVYAPFERRSSPADIEKPKDVK